MPYLLVLERASGTHKHSVQQALGLLTSTCSVVCLFPQVHSNKLRLAALEVPGFIFLWCLGAQRKGMVISMKDISTVPVGETAKIVFPVAVSERMLPSSKCGEEAIRAAEYRLILTNYPERQEIVLSS